MRDETARPASDPSRPGSDPSRPASDPSRAVDAAKALPALGVFLLMPPTITLFAVLADVAGIPLIVVYMFGVWLALIACAGLLARRLAPLHDDDATRRDAKR